MGLSPKSAVTFSLPHLHHWRFQNNTAFLGQILMTGHIFVLQPCMKSIVLISWDESGSEAEENLSQSRKCHFSVIVYDSSLHLWLNNEGWQLERSMGVEIKGLRFPLAKSGLSQCAPSKQDPDVEVCAAMVGCYQSHTTGPFCQLQPATSYPANRSASNACKHDRRLSQRGPGTETPIPNKRIPFLTELRATQDHFFSQCDLSNALFAISSLFPLIL